MAGFPRFERLDSWGGVEDFFSSSVASEEGSGTEGGGGWWDFEFEASGFELDESSEGGREADAPKAEALQDGRREQRRDVRKVWTDE